MAEYFTLDPRYKHYEYGGVKLAFKTVYNEDYLNQSNSPWLVVNALMLGAALIIILARAVSVGRGSGQVGLFVVGICIGLGLILYVIFRIWMHNRQVRRRLERLQNAGVLLDGTLLRCSLETKLPQWRGESLQKYLRASYQFTAPNQQKKHGTQIRMLDTMSLKLPPSTPVRYMTMNEMRVDDPIKASLPTRGTPIRVLYADPETYVML